MCEIRLLRADEIDVRAQTVKEGSGFSLLLYKDARCDMAILDETFGMNGWQRSHDFKDGNNYCTVSIWDESKKQWISKEDVGTESKTEKEKGQASDAFKRACFNIGIGRELYTSPFIWIEGAHDSRMKYSVSEIGYEDRVISKLTIVDRRGNAVFHWEKDRSKKRITADDMNDAQVIIGMMDWLAKKEKESEKAGSPFSIHALVTKHYVASDEIKQKIEEEYSIHKRTQK